jgi:hypothetical protein
MKQALAQGAETGGTHPAWTVWGRAETDRMGPAGAGPGRDGLAGPRPGPLVTAMRAWDSRSSLW